VDEPVIASGIPDLPASSVRHDGWTGERMAQFLEVLADTGIVGEACGAAGMSRNSAYSLRNRDAVFDSAWRAALTKARPLIADGILERSITGTIEHYYRDGVLVGERRHYESWLALAVLKRLDKLAEDDRSERSLSVDIAGNWQAALEAFRAGGSTAIAKALLAEADKDYTPSPGCEPCWRNDGSSGAEPESELGEGVWMTSFPPPAGFRGYERGTCDGVSYYKRQCTDEEAALLDADIAAAMTEERRCDERRRDLWFDRLRAQIQASSLPEPKPRSGNPDAPDPPPA